ncbi:MAG: HlyD family type I secretion periplasmic adaptor subunit [Alphaproteobacteria bacterium]
MKSNLPAVPPGSRPPVPSQHGRATLARLRGATALVDRLASRIIPFDPTALDTPEQRARPTILLGLSLMFLLFGVFGAWAALVPLSAGAVAPGKIVSDSSRKEIQHLEGGIVKEVLVKEGEQVAAGQVLVRLDSTAAQAKNEQLRGDYSTARAAEARLVAERDGAAGVTFPADLLAQENDPKVREALDTQRRLFATRHSQLSGAIDVYNQKIAQSADEIRGLREQVTAANTQIALLGEEIKAVGELLAKGEAQRPRLLALQRQQADLMGQRGNALAMISRANQTINESKLDILNQKNQFLNQVIGDLKDTQVQRADLEQQSRTASDVAHRIDITAPVAGIVTDLQVHTVGGVVRPGDTLMTLVPTGDKLIVEARVQPQDIDSVYAGLTAQVRLKAFKTRFMKPVRGTVTNVSADRTDDEKTGQSWYNARIEIPQSELAKNGNLKLTAGMPADVLIVTASARCSPTCSGRSGARQEKRSKSNRRSCDSVTHRHPPIIPRPLQRERDA